MKHYFVENPVSGKNNPIDIIKEKVIPAAEEAGIDYEVYVTKERGDAIRFVREKAAEAGDETVRFYAVGGDGTLYEVVNGAVGFPNAEVSVIPKGSGNDYIRLYGDRESFLDVPQLINGIPLKVDCLKVEDDDSGWTEVAINQASMGFDAEANKTYRVIITPIAIAGERLGTFFIYRKGEEYGIDDIILAEYGTAVIGLEMVRAMDEENAAELRRKQGVRSAISTLSTSEVDAVRYIFEEMTGKEGILVASKIADRVGITRSVIVNALRKLESAGVIESRSSGMKGTYIKIKNDLIREEIERSAEE